MAFLPLPPSPENGPLFLALQQNGGEPPTPQQINGAQVDIAAVAARSQVATSTLGQDWEHYAKLSEARQFLVEDPLDLSSFPYLAAMVEETGGDDDVIAKGIVDAAKQSNDKRAKIEAVRTAAKERLRNMNDDDHEDMQREVEYAQERMQAVVGE